MSAGSARCRTCNGSGAQCASPRECAATRQRRRPLVSVLVSFISVRHRSPAAARTVSAQLTYGGGPRRTPVNIVGKRVGATPREFESRILRHADQGKHRSAVLAGWRFEARWSHLLVSIFSARHHLHRDSPQLFCQVTGVAGSSEQRAARRRSVRLTVQGWPGPFATGRIPANYIPHHSE